MVTYGSRPYSTPGEASLAPVIYGPSRYGGESGRYQLERHEYRKRSFCAEPLADPLRV